MNISTIGIDLAKNTFSLRGINAQGKQCQAAIHSSAVIRNSNLGGGYWPKL